MTWARVRSVNEGLLQSILPLWGPQDGEAWIVRIFTLTSLLASCSPLPILPTQALLLKFRLFRTGWLKFLPQDSFGKVELGPSSSSFTSPLWSLPWPNIYFKVLQTLWDAIFILEIQQIAKGFPPGLQNPLTAWPQLLRIVWERIAFEVRCRRLNLRPDLPKWPPEMSHLPTVLCLPCKGSASWPPAAAGL